MALLASGGFPANSYIPFPSIRLHVHTASFLCICVQIAPFSVDLSHIRLKPTLMALF